MEQHLIDAILTVLGIAGTGIVGYVAKFLVRFIISKHLEFIASQAVRYAEDAFESFKGQTKLKHACEWVAGEMKKYHIKIDEATIEGAVRSAYTVFVQSAQKELNKQTQAQ